MLNSIFVQFQKADGPIIRGYFFHMLMGFIIHGYITNINLKEYQNVLLIDTFLQKLSPVFQLLLIKCYIF